MKKFLSIFFLFLFIWLFFIKQPVLATSHIPTPTPAPEGSWVEDSEVTFVGKNAARSGNLLDFILKNYNWVCVKQAANGQCDNGNNPLAAVWIRTVTFIVAPLLLIVIIVTALVIIVTRGRNLTIMRFIPRFIVVILLIFFSFALLQFFYQVVDVIQGFFLRTGTSSCPPECISQKDLLFVGWNYKDFVGLRLVGDSNTESAFISLLLTKLTAFTYFVMVGILIMRKIILWLFIIVAPIFPLLLFYNPIRNTGKIWIGEFFRWLLYAPLFALFLKGLVSLWRDNIPLSFINPEIGVAGSEIYPTTINILLGGPKQAVSLANSINLTETFALYIVSLIMLWGVIILPWVLLQIFLDYANNMVGSDNAVMKSIVNKINSRKDSPEGHPPSASGSTISLPFANKFSTPTGIARDIPLAVSESKFARSSPMVTAQGKAQVLSLTGMLLPTMGDIAKYDTSLISRNKLQQREVLSMHETLQRIGNPASSSTATDKAHFSEIHERLKRESAGGNLLATSILNAASTASSTNIQVSNSQIKNTLSKIVSPAYISSPTDRSRLTKLHDTLIKESNAGNQLATYLLTINEKSSETEIVKAKENITSSAQKGDFLARAILSAVNSDASKIQSTVELRSALLQIANPASIMNTTERERVTKLHDILQKESKENNNQLASSILSVSNKTTTPEIEKLQEKIQMAKEKSEPLAEELAQITKQATTSVLPVVNRVQTVSQKDYDTVRDIWKDNYKKLEVPVGMAGTRSEWIKDDIGKIDSIVVQLSSPNEEEVIRGMQEVSSILPFLLVGGFSKTEIIAYLKAKQEAAKETLITITKEEDETSMTVEKRHVQNQNTMTSSISKDFKEDRNSESLNIDRKANLIEHPSAEILSLAHLEIPKLTDIAQYEVRHLTKDKTESVRIEKMHLELERIGNPASLPTAPEREQYEKLRQRLSDESNKGDVAAGVILSAVSKLNQTLGEVDVTLDEIKTILKQISNPDTHASVEEKNNYTRLHEYLEKETKERSNVLAQKILRVNDSTSPQEIQDIKDRLTEGVKTGDTLAKNVFSTIQPTFNMPGANRMQKVTSEEYEASRQLWEKAYKQYFVPPGFTENIKGRTEWIAKDIADINDTINMLLSNDVEKKNKGIKKVSNILPFLLLGGFSFSEMIAYLKTKLDAANSALSFINEEEEKMVEVSVKKDEKAIEMTAGEEVPTPDAKKE